MDSALKFYFLDCYCIYYQRVFRNGELDPQFGIVENQATDRARPVWPKKGGGKTEWLMRW